MSLAPLLLAPALPSQSDEELASGARWVAAGLTRRRARA